MAGSFVQLGKFMVNDIFGAALGPSTAAVAAGFPSLVAGANMAGRFAGTRLRPHWLRAHRRRLRRLRPRVLLAPHATSLVAADPAGALTLFRGSALASIGIFAGMPVLLAPAAAEIFGARHSGAIYRFLWLTVPLANFVGTTIMSRARDGAYARHAGLLAESIDDTAFAAAFGAPKGEIESLVASKTVTLPLLPPARASRARPTRRRCHDDVFKGIAACGAIALAQRRRLPAADRPAVSFETGPAHCACTLTLI